MADEILVINAGSSSIKVSLFEMSPAGPTLKLNGQIENIGSTHPHALFKSANREVLFDEAWPGGKGPKNHGEAMAFVVQKLTENRPSWKPIGIGHRVVHGGTRYHLPAKIDATVRAYLESLIPLAPLHEPPNLKGIDAAAAAFPGVPQVACFDTAFHHGRTFAAEAYALPRSFYDEGIRRYGFHGLSYEYIVRAMNKIAPEVARGKMVVAHLGNGASMSAIQNGKPVDTTMGFTALDGLPMGTRCGQLDPGVMLHLMQERKMTADQISDLIYKKSGLLGLSGVSSDMRDLLDSKEAQAKDAVDYFVYRVMSYVGSLAAAMNGIDGLVFTAGIGEHAAPIRERVCLNLEWMGLNFDKTANESWQTCISKPGSKVSAWVVPTDEERMIALHVVEILN